MCEITRNNFEKKYPEIIDNLQSASFISIDCEFSGLFDDYNKCSLFDNPERRFNKLQKCLKDVVIVQLGLTTFKYDRIKNSFKSSSYCFYLMPTFTLKNSKFTCHLESIEFLCKHKFDFNKFFHDGINYLNKSVEAEILAMIQDESIIESLSKVGVEEIQMYCSRVYEWSKDAPERGELLLEVEGQRESFVYMLHLEIRKRFQNLWTYFDKHPVIKIKKLKMFERRGLMVRENEKLNLQKKLFDSILGFSRVMKELQNLKKPIIGHNFLIDLILIYKQFYNPSPVTYKEFKQAITNLFPNIYDTKLISFKLKEILPKEAKWTFNNLADLYHYLRHGRGSKLVIFSPLVNDDDDEKNGGSYFHEAGYDSYCTGYCFLKMAHIFSLWDEEKKAFQLTAMKTSSSWLMGAVAFMKNKVNIARAQVNYIVLDGKDPKSSRPGWLYVESKTGLPLDVEKILDTTAKYASVDIHLLNKTSALMAVASRQQVKEILNCFKNHNDFNVTNYNFFKHSISGRMILPAIVTATLALISFYCLRLGKNRSNC